MDLTSDDYIAGQQRVPKVQASASRNAAGVIHVSLCNLHPTEEMTIKLAIRGATMKTITSRVLTAANITTHNTFDQPNAVSPKTIGPADLSDGACQVNLPARSITVLSVQ